MFRKYYLLLLESLEAKPPTLCLHIQDIFDIHSHIRLS
jgi:hypothetical protein